MEVFDENDGAEVKISKLGAGEFSGEMGLFEKDVRSCTVRAQGQYLKINAVQML